MRCVQWVVPALALALCSCATTRSIERVDLDQGCATDITGMSAHSLQPVVQSADGAKAEAPPTLDFADIGQCVMTPAGKIPAALFKLGDSPLPAQISLAISADADATLAAAATLLDGRHQPIRRYGFDRFSRRGATFTIDIFVNPSDSDATYLLLAPDAAWVGKEDVSIRAGTNTYSGAAPVFFVYNVGYEAQMKRQFTDAGRLQIEIKPVAAAQAPAR